MAGIALLVVLVAGLVAWPTIRPWPTAAVPDPLPPRPPLMVVETLPRLTEQLSRWGASGQFTGGVLVARGDEVLFRQVHGYANRSLGTPLALDSRFRLASVSKQFTAAAILRLQDEGVLSVDDPLCQ
jgi:CubicO group peptidase (beta-lactamase class C family)